MAHAPTGPQGKARGEARNERTPGVHIKQKPSPERAKHREWMLRPYRARIFRVTESRGAAAGFLSCCRFGALGANPFCGVRLEFVRWRRGEPLVSLAELQKHRIMTGCHE